MDADRELTLAGVADGRRACFDAGAARFDAGAYWDAHEAWEARWRVERDEAARRFFQGMIQIAAALHKLQAQRAPEAAARLFAKGLAKLDAAPPGVELDLARVRSGVEACALGLAEGRFDPGDVPRLGVNGAPAASIADPMR
ncbi:MAG: DUF309 domain-containing protein [Polyangiales bacterium]